MEVLVKTVASEIEEKEIAEAEELAHTLEEIDAIPVEDEIDTIEDEAVPDDDLTAIEDEAVPDEDIATVEDDAVPADDIAPVDIDEAEPPVIEGTPKKTAAALCKLPKEPDEQIYNSLFSQFIDKADAIAAVKERIKYHTIRHRGTAGLRLFWQWLDPDAAADPLFVPLKGIQPAVSATEPSTPADEDVLTPAEPVTSMMATSTPTNEDAPTSADVATPAATPGSKEEHEVPLSTRLKNLPKEADAALYEEMLTAFPSVDEAVETVQGQIKDFLRRRKSTVALKAFLGWLEEKQQ